MAIDFCALCNDPCTGANASIGNNNMQELWRTLVAQALCGLVNSGNVQPPASAVVTQAPVTVNATTTEILAANATRKGGELRVPVNSTVPIFINFGIPATVATGRRYEPGDVIDLRIGGVLYTGAVNGIVASGTQVIEVTEL